MEEKMTENKEFRRITIEELMQNTDKWTITEPISLSNRVIYIEDSPNWSTLVNEAMRSLISEDAPEGAVGFIGGGAQSFKHLFTELISQRYAYPDGRIVLQEPYSPNNCAINYVIPRKYN